MTHSVPKVPPARLMLTGFAVWLAATVAVRLAGQWLFVPEAGVLLPVFLAGAAGMFFLIRFLLDRLAVAPGERVAAAAWLLLPALFLDGLSLLFTGALLPNLSQQAAVFFGAWLLTLYGATFLSALTYSKPRS